MLETVLHSSLIVIVVVIRRLSRTRRLLPGSRDSGAVAELAAERKTRGTPIFQPLVIETYNASTIYFKFEGAQRQNHGSL